MRWAIRQGLTDSVEKLSSPFRRATLIQYRQCAVSEIQNDLSAGSNIALPSADFLNRIDPKATSEYCSRYRFPVAVAAFSFK
jgi:hypothetical protein